MKGNNFMNKSSMNDLLFELVTQNKHVYKLYLDGRYEGFPKGTIIKNHAYPLFCLIMAKGRTKSKLK
jgi:hypothetical protein